MRLYTQVQVQPGGSSSWKDGVSTCSPVTPPVSAAINLDRCWGNYLWTKNSSRQTGEKARFQSTNKTGCEFPLIFHQVQAGWTPRSPEGQACTPSADEKSFETRLHLWTQGVGQRNPGAQSVCVYHLVYFYCIFSHWWPQGILRWHSGSGHWAGGPSLIIGAVVPEMWDESPPPPSSLCPPATWPQMKTDLQ